MEAGTDPGLKLIVDGKPVPGALLSVRDGIVYAPAMAVYPTVRDPQRWQDPQSYHLWAANERYAFVYESLAIAAGESKALIETQGTGAETPLLAGPYIRFGRLMLPVAPVAGEAAIPYGNASHNPAAGTVTVTHGADWPGFLLPIRPDQLHFMQPLSQTLGAGFRADVRIPQLLDAQGNLVRDRQMPPVTFTLDQAAPIRFENGATTFTSSAENAWKTPTPSLLPDATVGTYTVRSSADGYAPVNLEINVVN